MGPLDGPGFESLKAALEESDGRPLAIRRPRRLDTTVQCLCRDVPRCRNLLDRALRSLSRLIHAPNESVDPLEIEHVALAEALFLQNYAKTPGHQPPVPRRRLHAAHASAPPGRRPTPVYATGPARPHRAPISCTSPGISRSRSPSGSACSPCTTARIRPSSALPTLERPERAVGAERGSSVADRLGRRRRLICRRGAVARPAMAGTRYPTRPGRCTCLPCSKHCRNRRMCP